MISISKPSIIVITGSSGVGKDTILTKLISSYPQLAAITSVTTRWPAREHELFIKDYYFVDDSRFDWLLSTDQFIESTEVYGHRYGTLKAELERIMRYNQTPIIEVDPAGVTHYRNSHYAMQAIYLDFPNADEQKQRLLGREPHISPEELDIRLAKAAEQRAWASDQEAAGNLKIIVNNKIADCVSLVANYLNLEK